MKKTSVALSVVLLVGCAGPTGTGGTMDGGDAIDADAALPNADADANTADGPAPTAMKFHPGLWGLFGAHEPAGPLWDPTVIEGKDYYVGVERSYLWRDVEPEYGVYDFSAIEAEKAIVAATGRKLGVELNWTQTCVGCNPLVPRYMWDDPSYGGLVPGAHGAYLGGSGNNGWVPVTWNPKVQARIDALLDAFALAFDDDPDIAFLLIEQETTHGATTEDDPAYTCGGELQAIKDILTHAYATFTWTPVFYELDRACFDIPTSLHDFLIAGGHGAWTIDAPTCNAALDTNAFSLYRRAYAEIGGAVFLDGWNDVHGWPCYESAADILAGIGPVFRPRYFLVDQSNSPNQAEINLAVEDWWNAHGRAWPFLELPTAWVR